MTTKKPAAKKTAKTNKSVNKPAQKTVAAKKALPVKSITSSPAVMEKAKSLNESFKEVMKAVEQSPSVVAAKKAVVKAQKKVKATQAKVKEADARVKEIDKALRIANKQTTSVAQKPQAAKKIGIGSVKQVSKSAPLHQPSKTSTVSVAAKSTVAVKKAPAAKPVVKATSASPVRKTALQVKKVTKAVPAPRITRVPTSVIAPSIPRPAPLGISVQPTPDTLVYTPKQSNSEARFSRDEVRAQIQQAETGVRSKLGLMGLFEGLRGLDTVMANQTFNARYSSVYPNPIDKDSPTIAKDFKSRVDNFITNYRVAPF